MTFKPLGKAYGPSPNIPRLAARVHHERRKCRIEDNGIVTTGYNYAAIELCCRPIGGIVVGGITETP